MIAALLNIAEFAIGFVGFIGVFAVVVTVILLLTAYGTRLRQRAIGRNEEKIEHD